jgi:very-short-patch-repair endonuclease
VITNRSYTRLQKAYTNQTNLGEIKLLGLLVRETDKKFDWRIQFPMLGSREKVWIVDFIEYTTKTVVEFDGPNHRKTSRRRLDAERDEFLKSWGFGIVRIRSSDFRRDHTKSISTLNEVLTTRYSMLRLCPFCKKEINPSEPTHDVRSCVVYLNDRLNDERRERLRMLEMVLTIKAELNVAKKG